MLSVLSYLVLALSSSAAVFATPIETRSKPIVKVSFSGPGIMYLNLPESAVTIDSNFKSGDFLEFDKTSFTAKPIAGSLDFTLTSADGPCGIAADTSLTCGKGVKAAAFSGTQQDGADDQIHISDGFFMEISVASGLSIFSSAASGIGGVTVSWIPQ